MIKNDIFLWKVGKKMAKAKRLPSGNWRVLLYIGKDNAGKPKYKSFTAESKRAAELMAAEYAVGRRTVINDMLFSEAFDAYIKSKSNILSVSTLQGYKSIRRLRFQSIMNVRLSKLTIHKIQIAVNEEAQRTSPKTVRNAYSLLSSVLSVYAPDIKLSATLPKKVKPDLYIPQRWQIQKIYEVIKDTPLEIPFLLASQCGLRLSEVCGLRYEDIQPGIVHIKRAMLPDGNGGMVLKQPKSASGYRDVVCSTLLTDKLLAAKNDNEYVVSLSYNAIEKRWHKVLTSAGIPHFRFHDLRHYFASEGLLMGVPPRYMAEMMGHSSTDMINRVYQHVFPGAQREFALGLSKLTDDLLKTNKGGNTQ